MVVGGAAAGDDRDLVTAPDQFQGDFPEVLARGHNVRVKGLVQKQVFQGGGGDGDGDYTDVKPSIHPPSMIKDGRERASAARAAGGSSGPAMAISKNRWP